jgi:hypothetical protein
MKERLIKTFNELQIGDVVTWSDKPPEDNPYVYHIIINVPGDYYSAFELDGRMNECNIENTSGNLKTITVCKRDANVLPMYVVKLTKYGIHPVYKEEENDIITVNGVKYKRI